MIRYLLPLCALLALTTTSCSRSRSEFWEDTKTCTRYMGKGVRSLFGKHVDSRESANYYESWSEDLEFIPLVDATTDYTAQPLESPGDPGSAIPGIDGFYSPSGKLAELFSHVHFDTDKYTVQGSENVKALLAIAEYLNEHPGIHVFVEGHADERGAAAYNLALGSRRANAVRNFLVQNHVNPQQLYTISYGKERPFVLSHDETSWKQNRRAQFRLYDKVR